MAQSYSQKIILWGAQGVGKSTFINALSRELPFLFPGLELDGGEELPPLEQPTHSGREYQYRFRILNKNGEVEKIYNLGFYDDKGGEMEKVALDIDEIDSFIKSYVQGSAKGIIVLFDPNLMNDMEKRQKSARMMKGLLKLLSQRSDNCFLAVCMNKMDTLDVRWSVPETVFELCFGDSWGTIKKSMANTKNVAVKYFLTSAAGFVKGSSVEYSNFFDEKIAVEHSWRPWNVSAPFFWIFENFEERESLPWYATFLGKDEKNNSFLPPFF